MTKIKYVLFLCSGNTCRSVAAEYIAKWLKKTEYPEELKDVTFDSAGLYHYYEKAQEGTEKYIESKGMDITDFQAKEITEQLAKKADLILGFEKKYHIKKVKRRFKNINNLNEKLHLLLDFAGNSKNIEIKDPFDYNEEEYREVMERIEKGVRKAIKKIIEINEN